MTKYRHLETLDEAARLLTLDSTENTLAIQKFLSACLFFVEEWDLAQGIPALGRPKKLRHSPVLYHLYLFR